MSLTPSGLLPVSEVSIRLLEDQIAQLERMPTLPMQGMVKHATLNMLRTQLAQMRALLEVVPGPNEQFFMGEPVSGEPQLCFNWEAAKAAGFVTIKSFDDKGSFCRKYVAKRDASGNLIKGRYSL